MTKPEEWDWPPPRRSRADQIDLQSRVINERIVRPLRRRPDRATGLFVTSIKALVAIPLAGVVLGAVWLISAIVSV